jgi:hypothetical protein
MEGEKGQRQKVLSTGRKNPQRERTPFLKESRAVVSHFTNDLKLGNM